MTAYKSGDPTTLNRLYGRTKGKKLRGLQSDLMDELLPKVSVPEEGEITSKILFGADKPLHFEIGFGSGEHLATRADMLPDHGFIGCEPYENGVAASLVHIDNFENLGPLGNIRLHMGNALDVLERIPDGSLSFVYLLHPDPWPKARHAKNRARLARFEELNGQEFQRRNETLELYIPPGPRLGDVILEVEHVSKGFGEQLLIDDLNFSVPRGAIVGIIGGNGAGKSTLFRMISGTDQPDSGTVRLGETVVLGHVAQSRDSLSDDKNVWEEISEGNEIIQIGRYETPSRGYVSRFNFKGGDQQKMVRDLSGGERNRVHLAKLLKKGANFLLLDEPTNDLDVETLRALESAIEAYPGTLMVISHDRWFLDRIATHILAFEGNSHAVWFDGNYSEYEEDHRKRMGDKGPTRVKYKKLA